MLDMLKERGDWQGDLKGHLKAFCARKWNCDFSEEMSRSVHKMLETWVNEEGGRDVYKRQGHTGRFMHDCF